MGNRKGLWAALVFLMIPAVLIAGGALFGWIDPEKLAGHTDYVRSYRLIELARRGVMQAMFGLTVVAWFVTCLLVLRAKNRSYGWLLLALLGSVGFVVLASLRDLSPEPSDLYERFNHRLGGLRRVAYEACVVVLVFNLAWGAMVIKRDAGISYESARTGVPRSQIVEQRDAESGMWAFSEGNEVMYFFVLLYLLRPIAVNMAGSLLKGRRSSG